MRGPEVEYREVVPTIDDSNDCLTAARRASINQGMIRIFQLKIVAFLSPPGLLAELTKCSARRCLSRAALDGNYVI
jgi:hypothetical protein